ncbi:MAG TPA: TIGR02611 family protein [Cryptosporangiaceae bacterium]|nr:TIGR02611 family protein [Cryptosporangiaceae bacterium]
MRRHLVVRKGRNAGKVVYRRVVHPVRTHRVLGWPYRILVGVVGTAILVVGIVMIPAPGPGWLVVLGGLAVLATEFAWARRLLRFTRHWVRAWTGWVMTKPLWARCLFASAGLVFLAAVALGSLYASGHRGFPFG